MTIQDFVTQARASKFINEKRFGDISSFNFSRKAFYDSRWDEYTMKARGLFINTRTNQIVARGYDKFFNLGENQFTSEETLKKNLVYPLHVYQKENGYLGLISLDHDKDDFFFATKSMCDQNSYVNVLKDIFLSTVDTTAVMNYLKENASSLIVEVISPWFDPHIIEYNEDHLVLLDIVQNTIDYSPVPYSDLCHCAHKFFIPVKAYKTCLHYWEEVEALIQYASDPSLNIEGFVIEDACGFHFKLKTAYYKKWKKYRWQSDKVLFGLMPPGDDAFLNWCLQNDDIYGLRCKSIIERRNEYERWQAFYSA